DQVEFGVLCPLVPAKAGTQGGRRRTWSERPLDSRLRGNERKWINSNGIRSKCGNCLSYGVLNPTGHTRLSGLSQKYKTAYVISLDGLLLFCALRLDCCDHREQSCQGGQHACHWSVVLARRRGLGAIGDVRAR